ncbi:hypothetical protein kac65v162_gp154 [Nodularia phage vB_NspS-kac65v162]|uniref:Uncharacterized protein n=3 Tax=Ravarandavirus kac65v151 TaxID=2845689 RepID=A0A482MJA3_9CAUD|nr:hypothetical protein HWC12_gp163 [Nodularia phage vB_NspS-kac65v151]QBQ73184.1 hypothetical protein kac65v151_gp154 [Nodularia phage vB_NspS-kac65v151]QBQ73392.1 hypothetical protein kac65v161_gp154 [Nodularia phage vB_NspS-kac65v161]QBQ73598.1 hypothetical protein kac65v162_gp154 [Nodularia phage vB_NspS-kac65v162]
MSIYTYIKPFYTELSINMQKNITCLSATVATTTKQVIY